MYSVFIISFGVFCFCFLSLVAREHGAKNVYLFISHQFCGKKTIFVYLVATVTVNSTLRNNVEFF